MNAERSAALVRRWVAVYTLGLPPEIKQRRRDEIDDDLWCQAQEAAGSSRADRSLGGEILARLVFGVPADVSWRIEQIGHRQSGTTQRSMSMNAPGRALLAILGGIGWAIWPIPQAMVGREWPANDPISMVLVLSVVGGTWTLAAAMVGFVYYVVDRIRGPIAAVVGISALLSATSVTGPFALIVALPIGSAALLWELGRLGAISNTLRWIHLATAGLVLVVIALIFVSPALYDDRTTAVPLLALAIPYGISWLAFGWSALRQSLLSAEASGA